MPAITRGRTIAAAGFLAASTLLGTALAAGPVIQHEGHAAMQQDAPRGCSRTAPEDAAGRARGCSRRAPRGCSRTAPRGCSRTAR